MFSYIVSQNEEIVSGNLCISDWNDRAQYLISQIAHAVHYFHFNRQVAHLDISLENTLIGEMIDNETGQCIGVIPKIIDFGLSEHLPPKLIYQPKTQQDNSNNNNKMSTKSSYPF